MMGVPGPGGPVDPGGPCNGKRTTKLSVCWSRKKLSLSVKVDTSYLLHIL